MLIYFNRIPHSQKRSLDSLCFNLIFFNLFQPDIYTLQPCFHPSIFSLVSSLLSPTSQHPLWIHSHTPSIPFHDSSVPTLTAHLMRSFHSSILHTYLFIGSHPSITSHIVVNSTISATSICSKGVKHHSKVSINFTKRIKQRTRING